MFPEYCHISSDDLRQQLTGNLYDPSRNSEVWDAWHYLIRYSLDGGGNAVADATNLSYKHRETLREIAEENEAVTHLIVFRNIGQAVRRNSNRSPRAPQGQKRVPDKAMIGFVMLYERMLVDIETEEYGSVTYIERTS
jgi:predicted kinase